MAPNGHFASSRHEGRCSQSISGQTWLAEHGTSEFQNWQEENPTLRLSYEEWKNSRHINGLALYYATLSIFDEPESSDDEVAPITVKPPPRGVRAKSAREPKKKLTTNGNGLPRAAGSATPSALANADESASTKRKRKARKKYLSEEIVASDGESEEVEGPSNFVSETATPTAPAITVNGKRKSSARKNKKKPLSEELIAPEDELDDSMDIDGQVTSIVASPLPARSAPKAAFSGQTSGSPKRTILKLSTRKPPRKKVLSEEIVVDDDTDEAEVPAHVAAPSVKAISKCSAKIINSNTHSSANTELDADSVPPSPDEAGASASATRRGLRTRRPAQQRPYYHDAQLFDDVEPDDVGEGDAVSQTSPDARSRRVSTASFTKGYDDELLKHLDEEALTLLQGEDDDEPSERKPKHFKGKGRAWKKEESDEDEEFLVAKRKAQNAMKATAKAKVKTSAPASVRRKRGRPRKAPISDDIVRDESDSDAAEKEDVAAKTVSPAPAEPQVAPKKARNTPARSVLSAEIVPDDSDSAPETMAIDRPVRDEIIVDQNVDKQDVVHQNVGEALVGTVLAVAATEVPTPDSKKPASTEAPVQNSTPQTPVRQDAKEVDPSPISYTPKGWPKDVNAPTEEAKSASDDKPMVTGSPKNDGMNGEALCKFLPVE